jgi:hypothetical protein
MNENEPKNEEGFLDKWKNAIGTYDKKEKEFLLSGHEGEGELAIKWEQEGKLAIAILAKAEKEQEKHIELVLVEHQDVDYFKRNGNYTVFFLGETGIERIDNGSTWEHTQNSRAVEISKYYNKPEYKVKNDFSSGAEMIEYIREEVDNLAGKISSKEFKKLKKPKSDPNSSAGMTNLAFADTYIDQR